MKFLANKGEIKDQFLYGVRLDPKTTEIECDVNTIKLSPAAQYSHIGSVFQPSLFGGGGGLVRNSPCDFNKFEHHYLLVLGSRDSLIPLPSSIDRPM